MAKKKNKSHSQPQSLRQMLDDYCASYPDVSTTAKLVPDEFGRQKVTYASTTFDATGLFAMSVPWKSKAPDPKETKLGEHKRLEESQEEKSFRFLDLPAELQNSIYEEFASSTYFEAWPLTASPDARALLHTCRRIRHDFLPILLEKAQLRICVEHWKMDNFDKFSKHLDRFPSAKKAAEQNKRIHAMIEARPWRFADHDEAAQSWLARCASMPGFSFTHEVYCTESLDCFTSRAGFLWRTGAVALECLYRAMVNSEETEPKRNQLAAIIMAFHKQADEVGEHSKARWSAELEAQRLRDSSAMHELSPTHDTDAIASVRAEVREIKRQVYMKGGSSAGAYQAVERWRKRQKRQ